MRERKIRTLSGEWHTRKVPETDEERRRVARSQGLVDRGIDGRTQRADDWSDE